MYNSALLTWEDDPDSALDKLRHLIENPPFPKDTIQTFLLITCQPEIGLQNEAAEFLVQNPDLTDRLSPMTLAFIEALILKESIPEEGLEKLISLGKQQFQTLSNSWNKAQALPTGEQMDRYKADLEFFISSI